MEPGANLSEENFAILTAQSLKHSIPNLFQDLATSNAGLCVNSGKGLVVVSRLEVIFLLFSELQRQPGYNSWQDS